PSSARNKAANAIRTTMMEDLGVSNVYDLNRFHLAVQSTIDVALQKSITDFLQSLSDEEVIKARGLNGEHLLENMDPKKLIYSFLERALERKYSASPYEAFFTGGGVHQFENFEREDNSRILMVHEAFRNSTNLVFIRLMRDVVMYHRARLAYDADDVLGNTENV